MSVQSMLREAGAQGCAGQSTLREYGVREYGVREYGVREYGAREYGAQGCVGRTGSGL